MDKEFESIKVEYKYRFPKDKFDLIEDLGLVHSTAKSGKRKGRTTSWHRVRLRCKNCGHIKDVVDTPYIGCKQGPCNIRWNDLTGKVFGDLTVLRWVYAPRPDQTRSDWQWLVKCKCGEEEVVTADLLYRELKNACRKCSRERVKVLNTVPGQGAVWNRIVRNYRKGALVRGHEMSISPERLIEICHQNCYYCGTAPIYSKGYGVYMTGVDRVDNTKGYTDENVVPCCKTCNIMKGTMTKDDFIAHINNIHNNMSNKGSTTIPEGSTQKPGEMEPESIDASQDIV